MKDQFAETVRLKLGNALELSFPDLTRREIRLPKVAGKAHAIVGMRRAGKTWFLYQCLKDRHAAGVPRGRLIYFNLEDERLGTLVAADLGVIVEEYYRQFPGYRGAETVTFCFDEIQTVPGWERFVRRLLDEEKVEIFISGSSARMLSREVATAMRGRAMETVVTPFSFREFARHHGVEAPPPGSLISARTRSRLRHAFDNYLRSGGFPEVQATESQRDRITLLQGYVDAVLFRDVVERHGVTNVPALRALVRHLLRNPAASVSVSKLFNDFRSRGIAVSKATLLEYVGFLEDSFLVRLLPVATASERQKQVNPRKIYLADHGLARAYSPGASSDHGHYLENIVACELFRQGLETAYLRTRSGYEVDFFVRGEDGSEHLVQVAADVSTQSALEREYRALADARTERPRATLTLITEEQESSIELDTGTIRVVPAWRWLLDPTVLRARKQRK